VSRVTRVPATRITPSASVEREIGSMAAFSMQSGYQSLRTAGSRRAGSSRLTLITGSVIIPP
jgi:hypothetical protein